MKADPNTSELLRALPGGMILLAIFAFLVFLAILWTFLPFAIFGLKRRLDGVNDRLDLIAKLLKRAQIESPPRLPSDPPPPIPEEEESSWSGFNSGR